MNTKNIVIAILVIVIVLLLWRNYALMFPNGKPVLTTGCATGAFLVDKDVSVSQFKFDVNTPTTRNLRTLKVGDCITGFGKRLNSGQELRYVTTDGFDITDAGKIV